MTNAAIYIVSAALTVAFASFISYSGGEDKWQRSALGIILIAMLAGGLKAALSAVSDMQAPPAFNYGTESSLKEDMLKESFEGGVARLVADEISCPLSLVRITAAGFDSEKLAAEKITVHLYGEAALGDFRRVKEIITENGFGECEVILSFEKNDSSAD